MLLNYKIKNYKTFKDEIELSFNADMHIQKFKSNTLNIGGQNILKSIGVYGPNNTGKTCLIYAINTLKSLMLNEKHLDFYNSFYDNHITEIEATYESNGRFYKYYVKYDSSTDIYLYEKLEELVINDLNKFSKNKIFVRNNGNIDIDLPKKYAIPINLLNNNIPFFKLLNFKDTKYEEVQKDYIYFANSISMISMDMPMNVAKTIELMQTDSKARDFIISFAKNCDLNIEDFGYSNDIVSDVDINNKLNTFMGNKELLKIWSKHHGHIVPSVFFDSVGTRKIISLSGYIYDALINGKVLLIDELDNSLHHVIIRAIIALFNNELNNKAQLIFTTHDALTMDLRRLFRKDQIYLTDIDSNGDNKIIHLSKEFTTRALNGIRGDEDIVDYYLKGRFGGVPTPDLFDSIFGVLNDE